MECKMWGFPVEIEGFRVSMAGAEFRFAEIGAKVDLSMECRMWGFPKEIEGFRVSMVLEQNFESQKLELKLTLIWNAKCEDLSLCSIELYIPPGKGTIILNGTGNIAAPSIDIFADGLTLEKSNTINASFLGYPPIRDYAEPCKPKGQPTTNTYFGYGASHAGTGGIGGLNVVTACDTYNTYLTQPQVNNTIIGNAIKPDPDLKLSMENFGSSGGCKYIYILKLLFTHTINLYTYIIICKHTHTHTHIQSNTNFLLLCYNV